MARDDVHDAPAGLFVPETVLGTQYFDRLRRRTDLTGEQRLLCAIIEDAVDVYLKHAAATRPGQQALFLEAERWIEAEDRGWIYSFESICDYLGLDGDCLRHGLRARKALARGEDPSVAAPAPDETAGRRRAINE